MSEFQEIDPSNNSIKFILEVNIISLLPGSLRYQENYYFFIHLHGKYIRNPFCIMQVII